MKRVDHVVDINVLVYTVRFGIIERIRHLPRLAKRDVHCTQKLVYGTIQICGMESVVLNL